MLKIAVCDDEMVAVKMIVTMLKEQLEKRNLECEFETFHCSASLVERLREGAKYDILCMDISMPGTDGIQIGVTLKEELRDTILLYISSREDLVFETFQARPFRFLRKAKMEEELPEVVEAVCQEWKRRTARKVPFQCGMTSVFLLPEKIIYVESFKKQQIIHCEDQNFETQSSLQRVMEQLRGYGFVQVHKSYYVNCRYIQAIDRSTLELDNHTRLPIGRSKLSNVKEAFRLYSMKGQLF